MHKTLQSELRVGPGWAIGVGAYGSLPNGVTLALTIDQSMHVLTP